MGGEKPGVCYTQCAKRGSPPRGRGKGWKAQEIKGKYGITPAWAGKSRLFIGFHFFGEDHPRVGGEKHMMRLHPIFPPGSPPRGRGKDRHHITGGLDAGITPAWAGKSSRPCVRLQAAWDHPRVGGEKPFTASVSFSKSGSPPRGRGKVWPVRKEHCEAGITPAWAGKRLKRSHRSGIFISGPIPFHSVLHRPAGSGGSRAGRDGSPAGQPQNAGPA